MRILATGVVLALAGIATAQEKLPTADELFQKYVTASGGKAAIEKTTSRQIKGTIDVITFGSSGTFEQYAKAPNKMVNVSTFDGYGQVIQAYDGKNGWASMPDTGLRDMAAGELAMYSRVADFYRELHLGQAFQKAVVTGKSKVGDVEAYVVEGTGDGYQEKLYFATQTGLLVRSEIKFGAGPSMTSDFQDYKEVNGMQLPHTMKQDSPEISLVLKFTDIKLNVDIDDAKFAKPAK